MYMAGTAARLLRCSASRTRGLARSTGACTGGPSTSRSCEGLRPYVWPYVVGQHAARSAGALASSPTWLVRRAIARAPPAGARRKRRRPRARARAEVVGGRRLVSARPARKQGGFVEGRPRNCRPTGRPATKPHGHREPGDAREVGGHREDVGQVHLQRVVGLLAQPEGGRGRGRRRDHVARREGGLEIAPDQGADLLGAQVVGVVVARGQDERAEDDAALHLGPEALVAGVAVHRLEVGPSGARRP